MPKLDEKPVIDVLNRILEAELAGVVRYTHYSFLVFGFGRIPIVSWLRGQANESLLHAHQVGEWITTLGAYPSLAIGPLLDSHQHDIAAMLRESLESEGAALSLYRELLELVQGRFVALEEFARQMIHAEELHAAEVDKMLRKPASSRHSRPGRVKEPSVASQGGALAVHDLLPAWPLLSAFLVASLILAVTPGPAVFYIVTRSVAQGRRCGLASVAGVALGNLGNAIGASLGLAVLF